MLLCTGIINTHLHGLGGGHFMTVYNKEKGEAEVIDAREEAPSASTQTMFSYHERDDASQFGALSIGVPGEVYGYWTAHSRHGKLPWKDLFQPSIKLAEDGFVIGYVLATVMKSKENIIRSMDGLSEIFVNEDGSLKQEGEVMYRRKLGETYRKIAEGGAEVFYNGSLADDIIADIQDKDGIITVGDLKSYQPKLKMPLTINLGPYTVYSPPPPSSGAVLSLILNILKGYNFSEDSIKDDASKILTYHRIAEAFKFAYAKRSMLGDEDYVDLKDLVKNMTSPDYGESLRMKIDDQRTHNYTYYDPNFYLPEDAGTAQVCVVDQYGNAVSVTSSINLYLGSKIRGLRTGIIFNDEMDDFSSPNITNYFNVPPSKTNFIMPGKRPMSSMTPTIVVDDRGDVKFVVGAAGGTKITTTISLLAARTLWFGDGIKTANNKPRFHHQLIPHQIDYEEEIGDVVIQGLRNLGHSVNKKNSIGVAMGILRFKDGLTASSDPRRQGGSPAGF
ncbi:glutathione hydrolase 1 proenzyme-like [Glandiceps talaboti]